MLTLDSSQDGAARLAGLIRTHLDVDNVTLPREYHYKSVPLAVIDAVFSIGVRYRSTENTVQRFCECMKPAWVRYEWEDGPEMMVSDFLAATGHQSVEALAKEVFGNRQRTSARNGILKAEAVRRWAEVLRTFGVERFSDQPKVFDPALDEAIARIPGQRSGMSLRYFRMLVGDENEIKPDRHIRRFLREIGQAVDVQLLKAAASPLGLSPRQLDYAIWRKMSRYEI